MTGTKLLREWDGVEHTVTVLKDGFDWRGRKFKSLSAVAREITGTRWNGCGREASAVSLYDLCFLAGEAWGEQFERAV